MRKIMTCMLVIVLLASAVPMVVMPAVAQQTGIPCDDGDNELTKEELADVILPYMLGEGAYTLDDVGDASWVYAYWGGKPKTIVDDYDRTVAIYRPLERVVCTFDQQIEALRILKVSKDGIVGAPEGTSLDTDFFPEFNDVTSIGTILGLYPDLVLLHTSSGFGDTHGNAQKTLEAADITVFRFNLKENYIGAIEKFGYAFDKGNEANEFLDWYGNILNTIEAKTKEIEDKPKVYPEGSGSYEVSDSDDWAIAMAGGKDIFAGASGSIDKEALVDQDPDIIIKPTWESGGYDLNVGDTEGVKEVRDEIMIRPGLQNMTAVKDGDVYVITTHLWTYLPKTGNRHFIGICYMAKWFNPTLFEDLDPKAIHQEYLTKFQGLDIDLDKQGVFVYHPEEHPDGN